LQLVNISEQKNFVKGLRLVYGHTVDSRIQMTLLPTRLHDSTVLLRLHL